MAGSLSKPNKNYHSIHDDLIRGTRTIYVDVDPYTYSHTRLRASQLKTPPARQTQRTESLIRSIHKSNTLENAEHEECFANAPIFPNISYDTDDNRNTQSAASLPRSRSKSIPINIRPEILFGTPSVACNDPSDGRQRQIRTSSDSWEPPTVPRYHNSVLQTKIKASPPRKRLQKLRRTEPLPERIPTRSVSSGSFTVSESERSYDSSFTSFLSSSGIQARFNVMGNHDNGSSQSLTNRSSRSFSNFLSRWKSREVPRAPSSPAFSLPSQIRIERRVSVDQQSTYHRLSLTLEENDELLERKRQWKVQECGYSDTMGDDLQRIVKLSTNMRDGRRQQKWTPRT